MRERWGTVRRTSSVMLLMRMVQRRRLRTRVVCRRRVEQTLRPLKPQTLRLRVGWVLDMLGWQWDERAHWSSGTVTEMANWTSRWRVHRAGVSQWDRGRNIVQAYRRWAARDAMAGCCGVRRVSLPDRNIPRIAMGSIETRSAGVNRIAGDARTCCGCIVAMVKLVKWDPVP